MRAFWIDIGKLTVLALAVVGVLCLLGVTAFWSAMAGLLVLDIILVFRLNFRRVPRRSLKRTGRFGSRQLFLN